MSPQGDDQSPPPPTAPWTQPSPPPLWEDAVKSGMKYRPNAGRTYEYRRKSYLGQFAVKLGLTIIIPQALRGHTMTCYDATRNTLLSPDIIMNMLARSNLNDLTIVDFFWAWEDLYNQHLLDIFVKILGTFYGQVWGLVRGRLMDEGFKDLPTEFQTPWLRHRLLSDLLAAFPAAEGPTTPFIVEDGKVKISIPALSSSATTTTSTTLSIIVTEIPDIDTMSEEERNALRDYLIPIAQTAISRGNNSARYWKLFGIDSEEREFAMSEKQLQGMAWIGDAALHRLSREVLMEVTPTLPLGCIKAVAKTFNSNPVQAAFARRCGWYKNPPHLSRVKADHLGGTFVEGPFCLSFEANFKDGMASAKMWVKDGLECIAQPLVQAYKYFFTRRQHYANSGSLDTIQTFNYSNTATHFPSLSTCLIQWNPILVGLISAWWNLLVRHPTNSLASSSQSSRPRDPNITASHC